jgi:hypothetical protein
VIQKKEKDHVYTNKNLNVQNMERPFSDFFAFVMPTESSFLNCRDYCYKTVVVACLNLWPPQHFQEAVIGMKDVRYSFNFFLEKMK